jgi:hypothetical protein
MRSIHRRTFLSMALLGCGAATAATSLTTGLGQSWPNARDVSASPHYHVYLFQRAGIRYVQVNDIAGTVRGAVAVIDGEALDLPVGVDASRWANVADVPAPATSETVYRDDTVTVLVAPLPDGAARLMLASGDCDNPAQCSIRGP